jgi:hypothetical protein
MRNKGATAVSLQLGSLRLLFVGAHFAAHDNQVRPSLPCLQLRPRLLPPDPLPPGRRWGSAMQITTGSAVACSPPHPAARQQHRRAPPSAWVAALGTPSHGAARQRQHRRPVIFHQAASIAHSCTSPRPASRPRRARRPSPEAPQQTRAKVGHGAAAHCRPQPHLTAPTVAQLGGAGMWCAGQACAGAGAGRQAAWRCVRCRVRDAHCEPCMGGGSRALHQQPSTCAARKLALVVQATLGLSGAGTQQVSAGWVAVCNLRGGGGQGAPAGPRASAGAPPGQQGC